MSEAIRQGDPEGVWVPSSWSFDLSADDPGNPWQANWTPDDVHDYLDAIEVPHVVWDLWSEEAEKYKTLDYFRGHTWGFGVLHSFGAGSHLHGDVVGLVDRVHELINEPRAHACELFANMPEIVDFNGFYLELAAKLSWDPVAVTVERHIQDWCRRRYGEEHADALAPAWRLLTETSYGPDSGTVKIILDPLYWFRPDLELCPGWPEDKERTDKLWAKRPLFVKKLRHATEILLARKALLEENPMACRDLVDIAKQWLADRSSLEIIAIRDAFLDGDQARFETSARQCLELLEDQARLLASWEPYRLDRKIERHVPIWGDDAARSVKHMHVWVSRQDGLRSAPLRDYYRQDLDGLVAHYYRERVAAYIELLREKLNRGVTTATEEEFEALYHPIEDRFIHSPTEPLPEGEKPARVVAELLRR